MSRPGGRARRVLAAALGGGLLTGCAQAYPTTTPALTTAAASASATARATVAAGSCEEAAAKLSAADQAGLVVLVGLTGAPDPTTTGLIAKDHLGGVLLIGPFKTGVSGVRGIAGPLAASGLLVAARQEGGTFQTLSGPGFDTIGPAATQAGLAAGDLRDAWATWGRQLKDAGVHLNLAPSGDVIAEANAALPVPAGARDATFGSDASVVAASVTAADAGLQRGGVAASVSHFPGMGSFVELAGATATGAASDTVTTATAASLTPYRKAAAAGADAITVSTATYTKIDPASPAVFSAAVMTLLREDVRFAGVVVSEDLASPSLASVPSAQRVLRFVQAGGDLAVVSDPAQVDAMVQALTSAAASDKAVAARLAEASASVLVLRAKSGLATCTAVKG